jgi:hypothetical protein
VSAAAVHNGQVPDARLSFIIARKAPAAVIFRRGPSKQVALISWDMKTDQFEVGQWFHGRIYEDRCDLSPSGEKLLYFAASFKGPYQTWTAVSRPPFLTALALWPHDDTWGGGGRFEDEDRIAIALHSKLLKLAEGFTLPKKVQVESLGAEPGGNLPIPGRWKRDGWRLVQVPEEQIKNPLNSKLASRWIEFDPPYILAKTSPTSGLELRMIVVAIRERNGPWWVIDHAVRDEEGHELMLERVDCADWEPSGDLVLSRGGKLFRVSFGRRKRFPHWPEPVEIADFSALRFTNRKAPPEATRW